MSTDIAQLRRNAGATAVTAAQENPFSRGSIAQGANVGTIAIEQERAIAEVQAKLIIAKRFPRDEASAYAKIMEACSRIGFAEEALYSYPRGKETVSGPSIRMAEELARCWGNIDYGLRELSRRDGESEYDAYCWDMQTNAVSSQKFTVRHKRDTRGGGKDLTEERDIYEIGANMGARRMRARILAIIPGDVQDAAVEKCRDTLRNGGADRPLADRVRAMVAAFSKLGVTVEMLTTRKNKPTDQFSPDDCVELQGVYKSIRDHLKTVDEWFGVPASHEEPIGDDDGPAPAATTAAGADDAPSDKSIDPPTADTVREEPEPTKPKPDAKPKGARSMGDLS